jgi:triosephosphate isomerase
MQNKKIIFNWKMRGNIDFSNFIIEKFKILESKKYDFIFCPPSPLFFKFCEKIKDSLLKNIFLGSQNCSDSQDGNFEDCNFTGEINISLLKEFYVKYCIIGHSERKKHFFEQNNNIISKMEHLLHASLIPIVCVNKFFEDKELINNIINMFLNIDFQSNELVIAYEPIGAIGTGIAENIYAIEENINLIKDVIKLNISQKKHKKIYIIYGGSVSHQNIKNILDICDGVLIGKASTSYEGFENLISVL